MIRALPIVLLCCTALAQSAPRLLVDVNTEPVSPSSSNPDDFARFGAWVFFSADDGVHGRELFRTNGMAATTGLFADLRPGPDGSDPRDLVQVGTRLFLTADDGVHGRELWISDGTAGGTRMLPEFAAGATGIRLDFPVAVGPYLTFMARNELWSVDSRNPAPIRLAGSTPQLPWLRPLASGLLRNAGSESALFLVQTSFHGQLWRTDGTPSGTTLVVTRAEWAYAGGTTPGLVVGGSFALVTGHTPQRPDPVWITDGTPQGTVAATIAPRDRIDMRFAQTVAFDGVVWIVGIWGDFAWMSDGTVAGTTSVVSPWSGPTSYARAMVGVLGGSLWLIGWDGAADRLLRVDAGSTMPVDVGPLPPLANLGITRLTPIGSRFVGMSGRDALIAFDPLGNSAQLLGPARAGARSTVPFVTYGVGYYCTPVLALGGEPAVTDGTNTGTRLLADLNTQPPPTWGVEYCAYGRFRSLAILGAFWWDRGRTLRTDATFVSDGTSSGTYRIADGMYGGVATDVGGNFVFATGDGGELWSTDGSVAGSVRLSQPPGFVRTLTGIGDRIFAVIEHNGLFDLYLTDGRTWTPVAHLLNANRAFTPVRIGERICFRVWELGATALWVSDGTAAGTARIGLGMVTSFEDTMHTFGDRVWFGDTVRGAGTSLWSSDGTAMGTRLEFALPSGPVHGMRATASKLFLLAGNMALATDGTPSGMVVLSTWATFTSNGNKQPFALVGNRVLFDAYGSGGVRPFVSDGTIAGTRELDPALDRSQPADEYVEAGDGRVWFDAMVVSPLGPGIYVTDGTPAETRRVSNGSLGVVTRRLIGPQLEYASAGGRVFLSKTHPRAGLEPHVLDSGAAVDRLSEGCGVGVRRAELFATLGGSPGGGVSIEGRSSMGSVAQLVLSAPTMHPLAFPQNGACTLDVDPNAWVPLASLPIANQRFANSWPLPDDPALYGLQAVVQGFVGPTNAPLGADFTNGLLLSLGQ